MEELIKFEDREITTKIVDGEPQFLMKDIAEALGYTRDREGHGHEIRYEKIFSILEHDGYETSPLKGVAPGERYLTESMVYALVFKSESECAVRFRRWLEIEVLPSIRKNGYYVSNYTALAQLSKIEIQQQDALIDKLFKSYHSACASIYTGERRHYKEAWEKLADTVYEIEVLRRNQHKKFNSKARELGFKNKKQ